MRRKTQGGIKVGVASDELVIKGALKPLRCDGVLTVFVREITGLLRSSAVSVYVEAGVYFV